MKIISGTHSILAVCIFKCMKNFKIINITRLWLKQYIDLLLKLLVSFILGKISDSCESDFTVYIFLYQYESTSKIIISCDHAFNVSILFSIRFIYFYFLLILLQ